MDLYPRSVRRNDGGTLTRPGSSRKQTQAEAHLPEAAPPGWQSRCLRGSRTRPEPLRDDENHGRPLPSLHGNRCQQRTAARPRTASLRARRRLGPQALASRGRLRERHGCPSRRRSDRRRMGDRARAGMATRLRDRPGDEVDVVLHPEGPQRDDLPRTSSRRSRPNPMPLRSSTDSRSSTAAPTSAGSTPPSVDQTFAPSASSKSSTFSSRASRNVPGERRLRRCSANDERTQKGTPQATRGFYTRFYTAGWDWLVRSGTDWHVECAKPHPIGTGRYGTGRRETLGIGLITRRS